MQIGRETILRRPDGIEQHERADLSAVTGAMGYHVHEHFLSRHAARKAIRKREVYLFGQLNGIKLPHVVDIVPIAFSYVRGQVFQCRQFAQVRREPFASYG